MKNLLQIDLSPSMSAPKLTGNINRGSSDEGLFHSIYSSLDNAGRSESGNSVNVVETSQNRGVIRMNQTSGSGDMQDLKRKIHDLNESMSETIIPESALPELIHLLRSHGFSSDQIDRIIGLSRNQEGLVQIDKLFSQIKGDLNITLNSGTIPEFELGRLTHILNNQGFSNDSISQMMNRSRNPDGAVQLEKLISQINGNMNIEGKGNVSIIQQASIPQVKEMLFRMGLGAGDVRSVIEKSVNSKGEIDVSGLSSAMRRFFSEDAAESNILNFLAAGNIKTKPGIDIDNFDNSDLKKMFGDLPVSSSHDMLKHVKQNIAALLREKGVPVEEVKSFLDTFNLDISKTAKKENGKFNPEIMLNRSDERNSLPLKESTWNERVLGILRNERVLISERFNNESGAEKTGFKLDLNELIKQGSQKGEIDQLIQAAARSAGQRNAIDLKKASDSQSQAANIKDAMAANFLNIKMDRDIQSTGALSRSGEAVNLPQPLPKILERMFWMMNSGEQRSRIFINPPELGRLDLNLSIKSGHLQANLNAESLVVKEIIEANLNQLKQQLSSQGITVDRFDVMVGLGEERNRDDNSWAGWNRKRSNSGRNTVDLSPEAALEIPARKSIINNSQVDVHV